MAATATAIMVVLFMARSIGWEGVTDAGLRRVASFYGGKYGCHGCLPVKVDEKMSSASRRIRNCVVSRPIMASGDRFSHQETKCREQLMRVKAEVSSRESALGLAMTYLVPERPKIWQNSSNSLTHLYGGFL